MGKKRKEKEKLKRKKLMQEAARRKKIAQQEKKQEFTFLYEMESVICEYYNQERDIYDKDVALTMEQVIQNLKGKQISGELPMQVTKFINIIQNRCKEYVEQKETLSSNQMIKCFEWILTSVKRYSTDPTSRRYLEFVSKCMLKW